MPQERIDDTKLAVTAEFITRPVAVRFYKKNRQPLHVAAQFARVTKVDGNEEEERSLRTLNDPFADRKNDTVTIGGQDYTLAQVVGGLRAWSMQWLADAETEEATPPAE